MKFIDQIDLNGRRVFLRADLNVPLTEDLEVADDFRIRACLPTIEYALKKEARLIISSHLGRPKGQAKPELSLKPVQATLSRLLNREVDFTEDCIGQQALEKIEALRPGDTLLLENLRFHPEEEENDFRFAEKLSKGVEVYINDAFATAHRKHASTVGITEHVETKAAGFILRNELDYANKALGSPERPLLVIFGGSKISTKIEAMKNVAQLADRIIVGGAMANTFLAAQGLRPGSSLIEEEQFSNALEINERAQAGEFELLLPKDFVIASGIKSGVETEIVPWGNIPDDKMILDIGPATSKYFGESILSAKTIVWNGPMGAFEVSEFSQGTKQMISALSETVALTLVGGGDTDRALHEEHAFEKMDYVSTAGGAFLKLMEGKELPAISALAKPMQ